VLNFVAEGSKGQDARVSWAPYRHDASSGNYAYRDLKPGTHKVNTGLREVYWQKWTSTASVTSYWTTCSSVW